MFYSIWKHSDSDDPWFSSGALKCSIWLNFTVEFRFCALGENHFRTRALIARRAGRSSEGVYRFRTGRIDSHAGPRHQCRVWQRPAVAKQSIYGNDVIVFCARVDTVDKRISKSKNALPILRDVCLSYLLSPLNRSSCGQGRSKSPNKIYLKRRKALKGDSKRTVRTDLRIRNIKLLVCE